MQAKGKFEVKIKPVEGSQLEVEAGIGRMTIDKVWSGDLSGTSKGSMLTCATESTGAMAYLALEKVTATLEGKTGSFYFSHSATIIKGDPTSAVLKIVVGAASGEGELTGLTGALTINIEKGAHSYIFDYELP